MTKNLMLMFCVIAGFASASQPHGAIKPVVRPQSVDILPRDDLGQWVTRVQLVWDAEARILERRSLTVWRNFPGEPLDFLWLPDGDNIPAAGRIDGVGRLLWRKLNTSTADPSAVVSVYRGELVDGKAHDQGAFFHDNGLVYEGGWQNGLMHGKGQLSSPFGSVYSGEFREGRPHGDSLLVDPFGETYVGRFEEGEGSKKGRFTRLDTAASAAWNERPSRRPAAMFALQSSTDDAPRFLHARFADHGDVRIGIFVAPRLPTETWMSRIDYQGDYRDGTLVVAPEDDALVRAWLGGTSDLDVVSEASLYRTITGGNRWDEPVELRIAVKNDSTKKLRISGAYLSVKKSVPVLNPLVDTDFYVPPKGCSVDWAPMFGRINDIGWGVITDSAFGFQLGTALDMSAPMADFQVGPVDGRPNDPDLSPAFAKMGVDQDLYRIMRSCAATALGLWPKELIEFPYDDEYLARKKEALPKIEQCFERLRQSGGLGAVGRHMSLRDGHVLVHFVARYAYRWVDHRGMRRNSSRIYREALDLGDLFPVAGCRMAEAGESEPFYGNKVELKTKGGDYEVRVPLRAVVPAGEEKTWSMVVGAPGSSRHQFTIVLNARGERLESRPIDLTFFRPNRERLFAHPEEHQSKRGDLRWIQMASRNSFEAAKKTACQFRGRVEDVEVYRAMNGWHAIVTGPFPKGEVAGRIAKLKQRGAIPADSAVTNGERFIERVGRSPCLR